MRADGFLSLSGEFAEDEKNYRKCIVVSERKGWFGIGMFLLILSERLSVKLPSLPEHPQDLRSTLACGAAGRAVNGLPGWQRVGNAVITTSLTVLSLLSHKSHSELFRGQIRDQQEPGPAQNVLFLSAVSINVTRYPYPVGSSAGLT